MPLKCCVPNCNSNYKTSKEKVSVYKFPRDEEERKKWKSAIPRVNLEVTNFTAVCRHHWPDDCEFITVYGKSRPAGPPSVFKNIPISCLSSPPLKVRKTEKTSAASRSVQPDQLSEFQQLDKLVLDEIPTKLSSDDSLVVFKLPAAFVIQSLKFHEGVPEFVITVLEDFSYSLFYYGSSCSVPSLSNNKINQCKSWSTLYEIIRYAKAKEKGHKRQTSCCTRSQYLGKRMLHRLYTRLRQLQEHLNIFAYLGPCITVYAKTSSYQVYEH